MPQMNLLQRLWSVNLGKTTTKWNFDCSIIDLCLIRHSGQMECQFIYERYHNTFVFIVVSAVVFVCFVHFVLFCSILFSFHSVHFHFPLIGFTLFYYTLLLI